MSDTVNDACVDKNDGTHRIGAAEIGGDGETTEARAARLSACEDVIAQVPSPDALRVAAMALWVEQSALAQGALAPADLADRQALQSVIRWLRAHYGHAKTEFFVDAIPAWTLDDILREVSLREWQHRMATDALCRALKHAVNAAHKRGEK